MCFLDRLDSGLPELACSPPCWGWVLKTPEPRGPEEEQGAWPLPLRLLQEGVDKIAAQVRFHQIQIKGEISLKLNNNPALIRRLSLVKVPALHHPQQSPASLSIQKAKLLSRGLASVPAGGPLDVGAPRTSHMDFLPSRRVPDL